MIFPMLWLTCGILAYALCLKAAGDSLQGCEKLLPSVAMIMNGPIALGLMVYQIFFIERRHWRS